MIARLLDSLGLLPFRSVWACALLVALWPASAQSASPQATAASATSDGLEPAASNTSEPKVEHLVTEDSQVRIEETRVRGVTKRIVVHPKMRGMSAYEIQPADPALDPSHDPAAGKRLWNFGF